VNHPPVIDASGVKSDSPCAIQITRTARDQRQPGGCPPAFATTPKIPCPNRGLSLLRLTHPAYKDAHGFGRKAGMFTPG
jgi:hypothetical protein